MFYLGFLVFFLCFIFLSLSPDSHFKSPSFVTPLSSEVISDQDSCNFYLGSSPVSGFEDSFYDPIGLSYSGFVSSWRFYPYRLGVLHHVSY